MYIYTYIYLFIYTYIYLYTYIYTTWYQYLQEERGNASHCNSPQFTVTPGTKNILLCVCLCPKVSTLMYVCGSVCVFFLRRGAKLCVCVCMIEEVCVSFFSPPFFADNAHTCGCECKKCVCLFLSKKCKLYFLRSSMACISCENVRLLLEISICVCISWQFYQKK